MHAGQTHRLVELFQLPDVLPGKAVVLADKNSDEQSETRGLKRAHISTEELFSRKGTSGIVLGCELIQGQVVELQAKVGKFQKQVSVLNVTSLGIRIVCQRNVFATTVRKCRKHLGYGNI